MKTATVLQVGLLSTALMLAFSVSVAKAETTDWRKDAAGREVNCDLQVKGKTYLKGTCMYDVDADGSFRLMGDKYFVYLNMLSKGIAGASWNADPKSSHAQSPLGEDFKRKGACWVGKNAKICATDKAKPSPKPATVTPIKFTHGASSATVTNDFLGFDEEHQYSVAVSKGQSMMVEQINPGEKRTTIWLTDPKGGDASDADLSCNNKKQVKPTLAGTYLIKVSECMKADPWKGSYTLKITVK
ncbi:MAG TPA: hypothetical protein PLM98_02840 [Thiolinea sp.]|nr:hypothetical protein [Thiolinea sp.]